MVLFFLAANYLGVGTQFGGNRPRKGHMTTYCPVMTGGPAPSFFRKTLVKGKNLKIILAAEPSTMYLRFKRGGM